MATAFARTTSHESPEKIKAELEALKTIRNAEEYEAKSEEIKTSYAEYKKRLIDAYTSDQWAEVAASVGASFKDGELRHHTRAREKSKISHILRRRRILGIFLCQNFKIFSALGFSVNFLGLLS